MKTSNKILLTFFVAAIVIMTAVHLTVYGKYKKGDLIPFDEVREGRFEEHKLPKVKYISLSDFQRCNIMPSAEAKLKIFKMRGTRLSYKIVNDTLIIAGDSLMTQKDRMDKKVSLQTINLYLPGNEEISILNSQVHVIGSDDSASAPSWKFNVSYYSGLTTEHNRMTFFNNLQINTTASNVEFSAGSVIHQLDVHSTSSVIENKYGHIEQMQLDMDDLSTILLQGGDLKNIKLNTKQ